MAIQDKDNYKFILVTESDIPIISFSKMYKKMTSDNKSFFKLLNKNLEKQIHNEKTSYVDWSECQAKADDIWKKYKNNKPELKKRLADVWSHPKTFNKLDKEFIKERQKEGWVMLRKVK